MRTKILLLGLLGAAAGSARAEDRSVQYDWSFPRGNLVTNWSFESQEDQACQALQTLEVEVDCRHAFPMSPSGGHVLGVYVYQPAPSGILRAHRTDYHRVQGGSDYSLTVKVNFWAGASLGDIHPEVEFFDEARQAIHQTALGAYEGLFGGQTGSWATYAATFQAPQNAAFIKVSLAAYQSAAACQVHFDNLIITTGTNSNYVENRTYADALGSAEKEVLTDGSNDVVGFTEYDNLRRPLKQYAPVFGGIYTPVPGPGSEAAPLFTVNALLPNTAVPDFPNLDLAYDALEAWAAARDSVQITQEPSIAVVVDPVLPEVTPTSDISVVLSADSKEIDFTLDGIHQGTRKHLDLLASLSPDPSQPAPPPLISIPSYFNDPADVIAEGTFDQVYPGEAPFHSEASYPNPGINTIGAAAQPGSGYAMSQGRTDRAGWALAANMDLLDNANPSVSDLEVTSSALTSADPDPYFYQWRRDRQGNYAVSFTDAEGRLQKSAAQKDGGWMTTAYEYDTFHRLARTHSPEGKAVEVTYDGRGRAVITLDPDRGTVHSTYDDRDRVRFTRHAGNSYFNVFKYDLLDRTLGVAKVGDLTALTQPNADNPNYPANSLLEQGSVYDALTAEEFQERTGLTPGSIGLDLAWLGNTQGKRVMTYKRNQEATVSGMTAADRLAASFYAYDDRGRLSGVFQFVGPAPAGHKWHKIAYFYDEQDRLDRRVVYKDAGTTVAHNVTYQYDVRGRLSKMTDETGTAPEDAVEYHYDPLDRMAGVTLYDNLVMSYGYDIQQKPRFLEGDVPGQNLFAQYLGYEGPAHEQLPGTTPLPPGRYDGKIGSSLLKYSNTVVGAGTQPIEYRTYAYLPQGPLAETRRYQGEALLANGEIDFSQLPFGANPVQVKGYAFGADGGFISQSTDNASGTDSSLAYAYQGGTHRVGLVTRTVGGTPVTSQFTYDAEGRLTAQTGAGAKTLNYDFLGMPTNISSGAVTQHYFYGPDNFRVATFTEEASAITGKKVYVYEEGLKVAKEIRESGSTVQTRVNLYGQGELVGMMEEDSRVKRLLVKDHQGSVVQVVGDNGNSHDETFFADFGERAEKVAGDLLNPSEGWTGKEFEEEIGLTYFGARFYDPLLGTWLTPDPEDEFFDPYSYVGGDPINFVDPLGLESSVFYGPAGAFYVVVYLNEAAGMRGPGGGGGGGGGGGYSGQFAMAGISGSSSSGYTQVQREAMSYYQRQFVNTPSTYNLNSPGLGEDIQTLTNAMAPNLLPGVPAGAAGSAVARVAVARGVTKAAAARGTGKALIARASAKAAARKGVPRPTVTNAKLKNIVNDLYKGAKTKSPIGTGSTADAIRHEAATGKAVGGKFHAQKGQEYSQALKNWLSKNQGASAGDRAAAEAMLNDLMNALGGN